MDIVPELEHCHGISIGYHQVDEIRRSSSMMFVVGIISFQRMLGIHRRSVGSNGMMREVLSLVVVMRTFSVYGMRPCLDVETTMATI
eukprot:scaffold15762_cov448-Alexandrium_tamarense.AAC.1